MQCSKSSALGDILEKAKMEKEQIQKIKMLWEDRTNDGKNFLSTILQNKDIDILHILLKIYESPYIALKLAEKGFQTDPLETLDERPTALFYAALHDKALDVFRILYNLTANRHRLLPQVDLITSNRSAREADKKTLEVLKLIIEKLKKDKEHLETFESPPVQRARAMRILDQ